MISYNAKFVQNFYKSLYYIGDIKDSMRDHDLLTLFTYEKNTLKRSINKKFAKNIDFEDNIDNYLNVKPDVENNNKTHFLQRFYNYIEKSSNHLQTSHMLKTDNIKNLVISFTSLSEWKEAKFDNEFKCLEFIDKLMIERNEVNFAHLAQKKETEDNYNICMIIIVFPDKPMMMNKEGINFDSDSESESESNNSVHTNNCDELIGDFEGRDPNDPLEYMKEIIDEKRYPISIIEIDNEKNTIQSAINFVKEFIKMSRHSPFSLGFEQVDTAN
mmetsp:Transcript_32253/g.28573  ORF Transcript_32253/g.28573 Transcript_32253/m.28573 type:complete len:272 (+) Transcript_32253:651-1466(+)